VQLLVEPLDAADANEKSDPVLLQRAPELRNELTVVEGAELPEPLAEALRQRGVDPGRLRVFALRANADTVGLAIERRDRNAVLELVASPPSALDHAPGVYAAALAEVRAAVP
jgi:hypothetical protein